MTVAPLSSGLLFDPDFLPKPLEWSTLFPQPERIEVEVGAGKGRFLLDRAATHPDTCFVGLEFARSYYRTIQERALRRGLTNVRLARAEGSQFFHESVPAASIHAFHLLYPDPWPKKRHHRRRLIQHEFLEDLRRVLVAGGELNLATDHEDYFEWMVLHFEVWKGTFVMEARTLDSPESCQGFVGRTNYEIKFLAEGRPIYLLTGRRTGF